MGLAAPKNKIKLSHDPNNTKWTNNTESFGHRMMTSQGWAPGDYLGAKDASHAEFHTAANASHIRVVIKDNNLGLGAKIGSGVGHGECTGLDAFQMLLGRLNGKEEDEIEKEQKSREDLKRAIYTERKWGSIRFVKGGVLVGDKIQDLIEGEKKRLKDLEGNDEDSESSEDSDSSEEGSEKEVSKPVIEETKRSKKRKREQQEEDSTPEIQVERKSKKEKRDKKGKKNKKRKADDDGSESKISKKSKKDRKSKSKPESTSEATSETASEEEDEAARKARKKLKKEKRRAEKEKEAAAAEEESTKSSSSKTKSKSKKEKENPESRSESTTKESTPLSTGVSGRSTPMGIHSIRARNIAQKRMASMDLASLNQIFMVKS